MKARYQIFSLALALLMLFNTLYVSLTYAYYYLDRSDFIAQFCVNKDKPEMHCNGKCHLKKVVKQETNTDQQAPSKKVTLKEVLLYFEKPKTCILSPFVEKNDKLPNYTNLYRYIKITDFYHPPQG